MSKCLLVVAVELDGDQLGRIRLRRVADASGHGPVQFVSKCVEPSSTVHTDCRRGCARLQRAGCKHWVSPP